MTISGKIALIWPWNDFCWIPLGIRVSHRRSIKKCKKFEFLNFWERPQSGICEYAFNYKWVWWFAQFPVVGHKLAPVVVCGVILGFMQPWKTWESQPLNWNDWFVSLGESKKSFKIFKATGKLVKMEIYRNKNWHSGPTENVLIPGNILMQERRACCMWKAGY